MPEEPGIIRPPSELFEHPFRTEAAQTIDAQPNITFLAEKIDASGPFGIYIFYKDLLYPSEGWPFPEALWAVNRVKRTLLLMGTTMASREFMLAGIGLLVLPWKRKIRLFEHVLSNFNRSAAMDLSAYYPKPERFCTCCREFQVLARDFLENIGISALQAEFTAKHFAMLFEYDNAYRYRFQDVMSETTKEKLLEDPRRELKRIMELFVQRDDPNTAGKFNAFIRALSYAMVLPRIKKAFIKAVDHSNIENLQYSEADRYHCLIRDGYMYSGKTYAEREKEWMEIHGGNPPGQVRYESGV